MNNEKDFFVNDILFKRFGQSIVHQKYSSALCANGKIKQMSVAQMDKLVSEICMYEGEYSHAIIRAAEKFHGISD